MRYVVLFLIICGHAFAQVQPFVFLHPKPLDIEAAPKGPLDDSQTVRVEAVKPEAHLANATMISPQLAIVCAHSLHFMKYREGKLFVDKTPARLVYYSSDMALIYLDTPMKITPALVPSFGPDSTVAVQDGEPVVHRYFDWEDMKVKSRIVTWTNASYIEEGFDHGMSGSSIYKLTGEFIGIAEWTNGFVWNLPVIKGFLEKAKEEMGKNTGDPNGSPDGLNDPDTE